MLNLSLIFNFLHFFFFFLRQVFGFVTEIHIKTQVYCVFFLFLIEIFCFLDFAFLNFAFWTLIILMKWKVNTEWDVYLNMCVLLVPSTESVGSKLV